MKRRLWREFRCEGGGRCCGRLQEILGLDGLVVYGSSEGGRRGSCLRRLPHIHRDRGISLDDFTMKGLSISGPRIFCVQGSLIAFWSFRRSQGDESPNPAMNLLLNSYSQKVKVWGLRTPKTEYNALQISCPSVEPMLKTMKLLWWSLLGLCASEPKRVSFIHRGLPRLCSFSTLSIACLLTSRCQLEPTDDSSRIEITPAHLLLDL